MRIFHQQHKMSLEVENKIKKNSQSFSQRAANDAQLQAADCNGPPHGHKDHQGQNFARSSSPQNSMY